MYDTLSIHKLDSQNMSYNNDLKHQHQSTPEYSFMIYDGALWRHLYVIKCHTWYYDDSQGFVYHIVSPDTKMLL